MKKFIYILFPILSLFVASMLHSCETDDTESGSTTLDAEFGGDQTIKLHNAISEVLPEGELILYLRYGDVPVVIEATHEVVDDCSIFNMSGSLRQGEYILQYAEFDTTKASSTITNLGCPLTVGEDDNSVSDVPFNTEQCMFGTGTADDPFLIGSVYGFEQINYNILTQINDTEGMYYQMIGDIEMSSREVFTGVGDDISTPFMGVFDGGGYTITALNVDRDLTEGENSSSVGLFNYTYGASISNVNIDAPIMSGHTGVAALVGCVVGDSASNVIQTSIVNCAVTYSGKHNVLSKKITGYRFVGSLVGMVDEGASLYMDGCSNAERLSSSFISASSGDLLTVQEKGFFGGLIGGATYTTSLTIKSCENNLDLSVSCGTGLGGIVGCADTLNITLSKNLGVISAENSSSIATGGIVGGASNAQFITCVNDADISGGFYTGGIIGSTLLGTDDTEGDSYGNVIATSVINKGNISGYSYTGGICAASHACMSDCYNSGDIMSYDNRAGGMIGLAPALSAVACSNSGAINGGSGGVGGIAGEAFYFIIGGSANAGSVTCTSASVGGIIGLGGTCGAINYSSNYASVSGATGRTGGIAGSLGDADSDPEVGKFIANTVLNGIFCVMGGVAEGLEGTSNACETIENIITVVKVREVIHAVRETIMGCREIHESIDEKNEYTETASEIESEISETSDEYLADINKEMSIIINGLSFSGAFLTTVLSDNMLTYSYNNTYDFQSYLSSDSDGSIADDYNESIYTELQDIGTSNAKRTMIKTIVCEVAKVAISLLSCGVSVGIKEATKTMKIATSVVCTCGETAISAYDTWSDPGSFNVLSITQVSNFGKVIGGSGLIGCSGDRIRISQSLSAGSADQYAVADRGNAKQMVCKQFVCVGADDQDVTSDINNANEHSALCYTSTGKDKYYGSDSFTDMNNYESEDLIDSASSTSPQLWDISTFWLFALPNTNYFDGSFVPSTNI